MLRVLPVVLLLPAVAVLPASHASGAPPAPAAAAAPAPQGDFAAVSLAADRGISVAAAEQVIARQAKAGRLLGKLAAVPGFAGLWTDSTDRVKIGFTRAADVKSTVAAAGLTGEVDTVRFRYSQAQLDEASRWLFTELTRVNAGATAPLHAGQLTARNVVELSTLAGGVLTGAQRKVIAAAKARYGDMLVEGTHARKVVSRACRHPYCDPPLRGGIRIHRYGVICTAGFLARSISDNKLYQFTAGHCAYEGGTGTWNATLATPLGELRDLGPIEHRHFWGRAGDAAVMRVLDPGYWQARAWVSVTKSSYTALDPDYTIGAVGGSYPGLWICTTGAAYPRSDCGRVDAVGQIVSYEGRTVEGLAHGNFCGVDGDSGAPMYIQHTAYGLQVAGGEGTDCDSYYQGITSAAAHLNVRVALGT